MIVEKNDLITTIIDLLEPLTEEGIETLIDRTGVLPHVEVE